ncbi:hypothetical protein [Microcoleus sp. herbarium14]|uniref:hypothetical protein n=1 Tax=Microcoleus sp. herbarium14 TaxID=3055439 RepID=UPI002FCFC587
MRNKCVSSINLTPVYGLNYSKGYIGFEGKDDSLFAKGITYFSRWEKMSYIATHHCFIVIDAHNCIEATADGKVKETPLETYFQPNRSVFFRKPVGLTELIAETIVQTARNEVGKEYDFKAILVQALSGSLAGRLLRMQQVDSIARILDSPNKWVCSELCAHALEIAFNRDLFSQASNSLSPQELFESNVFEDWK